LLAPKRLRCAPDGWLVIREESFFTKKHLHCSG
jgi:hypothetical protein